MRRVVKPPGGGHIVGEFRRGNTLIRIADDCCVKTPGEVKEILERFARTAVDSGIFFREDLHR